MPVFLKIEVVSADSEGFEDMVDGETTQSVVLAFKEDDEKVLAAFAAATEAAQELEPDHMSSVAEVK
jgi:hypothetical protein